MQSLEKHETSSTEETIYTPKPLQRILAEICINIADAQIHEIGQRKIDGLMEN